MKENGINTTLIGDDFEEKCYQLIKQKVDGLELGVLPNHCRVYKKKGYYSKDREKDIVFDITVEVWPKDAERYVMIFFIECKNLSNKNVPVDDIEEFSSKINQVSGDNKKGVMISNGSFQKGVKIFAKNKGYMLIEVNGDESCVVMHRKLATFSSLRKIEDLEKIEEEILREIKKSIFPQNIKGLKTLSALSIQLEAMKVLRAYGSDDLSSSIDSFIQYLENKHKITFIFSEIFVKDENDLLGFFDPEKNQIFIDKRVVESKRFRFVLGHELGHYFLHKEIKVNQEVYDDFQDSEFNFFLSKNNLSNDKQWLEWQANKFSVCLFLPNSLFIRVFNYFRKEILGLSRPQSMFLDNQPINIKDYRQTVNYLAAYFKISKTVIKYRLKELNLIIVDQAFNSRQKLIKDLVSDAFIEIENEIFK